MTTKQLDYYISNFILHKNLLYADVEGSPCKIGQEVKILNNPSRDDTFDETFANKSGEVFFLEYECGCGQTFPDDPMIGVRLANGKCEEFWKEELEFVP